MGPGTSAAAAGLPTASRASPLQRSAGLRHGGGCVRLALNKAGEADGRRDVPSAAPLPPPPRPEEHPFSWAAAPSKAAPADSLTGTEGRKQEEVPVEAEAALNNFYHLEEGCRGDPNAWQCKDGSCISATWLCDGISDCTDGSDEENCVCGEKVPCRGNKQCIDPWKVCDRHKDCEDGSDEANCPPKNCLAAQWQCKNRVCIMEDWKCNGVDNCGDHSDEDGCAYCPEGMIHCDKGKCIMESLMCNEVKDCLDGTDEPSTCGKNCTLNNGGCMQNCTEAHWGARCSCGPGWNLHGNGQDCTDVDECAMAYGPCSQLCKNTVGSFTCDCVRGYWLSNGTTCRTADGATKILLAVGRELAVLDVKTREWKALVSTRTSPSSVAYDLLRKAYYWVDEGRKLHIYVPGKNEMLLYPDVGSVNSISVDWFTGQLYWTSSAPGAIFAGLSDGRGYVKILEKNVLPEQLATFPEKSYMYWVNREQGRTVIEAAGMDGSDRHVLATVTAEEPVGLTLDHITSRLYWISAYKKSIETIKADGTGRYTFPEKLPKARAPLGLAVFENSVIWADKEQLLSASRTSPGVAVLLNSSVSSFTVLHELLQPQSNTAACAPGLCSHICLLSPVHPKGYRCACPDGTFLLPSNQCAVLNVLYSTNKQIYRLEVGPKGTVLQQHAVIQEWPENVYLQDMDWSRGFIYWTDDKGELMRFTKETKAKLIIPTGSPVCEATVDITSGDLYWLTCSRTEIKVTSFAGMTTKVLYRAEAAIWHLFLDWKRASLYWLESGKPIQRLNLDGSSIREVGKEAWTEDLPIALDISSGTFLWASKDLGLKVLNLITHKTYSIKERWTHGVAAVYGPYLVTFNKTTVVIWNRRSGVPSAVQVANVQKAVVIFDTNLTTVHEFFGLPLVPTKASPYYFNCSSKTNSTDYSIKDNSAEYYNYNNTQDHYKGNNTQDHHEGNNTQDHHEGNNTQDHHKGNNTQDHHKGNNTQDHQKGNNTQDHHKGNYPQGHQDHNSTKCNQYHCLDDCVLGDKCIRERFLCDGIPHCPDGSDEARCWVPTPECALRCDNNMRCVPESWLCDGSPDCSDSADEQGCVHAKCTEQEFRCRSGQCVSYSLHCDGDRDCKDGSDEVGCPVAPKLHFCHSDEVNCPKSGECILKEWLCDGDKDCKDESDEQDCSLPEHKCGDHQWQCRSSECIPDLWYCDGQADCRDRSDETSCKPRKCLGYEFQCGETCINYTLVCNGRPDCQGGMDEGRYCALACQRSCSQICYKSPSGPKCACYEGFRLRSDRRSCKDINECKELSEEKCSQTCVNTEGSYMCTCHPGYLLEPDGHTCKVVGSEPKLLVAVQFNLILYGLRSLKEDVILTTEKDLIIFSIDYDLVEQKIFWMDLNAESIKWMNMRNKERGTLVKGIKSDCIAVDWVGRNLYWTDGMAGQIMATQLNGKWRGIPEHTVVLDYLDQPRSLALHLLDGLMYWSAIGDDSKIEQAGMDGSRRSVLLGGLGWPTSITLDLLSWKIFWSDDKFHYIGSAYLDGSGMKVFELNEIHSPFAVTVFEDYVYWSEMKTRTVQRLHKRTGKDRSVLIKRHGQPYGLKILHEVLQPGAPNPCAGNGCSHLCLLNPVKRGSCHCPVGLVLSNDDKTCVPLKETAFMFLVAQASVTQVYLKKLRSVSGQLTLPVHSTLPLTSVNRLAAVDYSVRDNALYFSESEGGAIKVLAMKDAGRVALKEVLPVKGTVISLALDWLSGNIYWIDSKHPSIQVATSDGRYTLVLISDGLSHPTSVVLHPPTAAMCFVDSGNEHSALGPTIECSSMDGSKRKVLWTTSQTPVGLTIVDYGTQVYWADQAKGTVESIRMDGTQYRVIRSGLRGLTLFTAGEGIMVWTTTARNGATKVWHSRLGELENWWFKEEQKLVDIKIYSKLNQQGSSGCSEKNGGCSHICLPVPQGRSCRCVTGYILEHGTRCTKPQCSEPLQACKDNSKCIAKEQVCDGSSDCSDGSDERDCNNALKKKAQPTHQPSTLLQTKPFLVKINTVAPIKTTTKKPTGGTAHVRPEVKKYTRRSTTATAAWALEPSRSQMTTLPPKKKWKEPSLVQGIVRSGLESQPCSRETCNRRGDCTMEGDRVKCICTLGYSGDYCEEEEGKSKAGLVLGIISILLMAMAAAGTFVYFRKQRTRQRTSSISSTGPLTSYQKDSDKEDNFVEDETCINAAYDPEQC
ncbi:low-density lipoprotein receptor-related protein 2-like [Zootoca vivipara]|uniref:low-density lipoprotein receptor-related protein 2-like n=1 Tax=Zootoca vivipara TaxID=8524 RepID=UPI00293BDC69|nr:low-density lipoprotein receptor-related protein 2-like [Zootoca vivipara]